MVKFSLLTKEFIFCIQNFDYSISQRIRKLKANILQWEIRQCSLYGEKDFFLRQQLHLHPCPHSEEPKGGYLVLDDCSPFLLLLHIGPSSQAHQRIAHRAVILSSARKKVWALCSFIDFIFPSVFLLSELTSHSYLDVILRK